MPSESGQYLFAFIENVGSSFTLISKDFDIYTKWRKNLFDLFDKLFLNQPFPRAAAMF